MPRTDSTPTTIRCSRSAGRPGGRSTSPRNHGGIPRSIPDQAFNELFAALTTNRDRALIAFYISTGARASELLGVTRKLVAPGGPD